MPSVYTCMPGLHDGPEYLLYLAYLHRAAVVCPHDCSLIVLCPHSPPFLFCLLTGLSFDQMSSEMDELDAQGDRDRGVYDLTDVHSGADHKATPASPPSVKGLDLSRAMRRCTRSHLHPNPYPHPHSDCLSFTFALSLRITHTHSLNTHVYVQPWERERDGRGRARAGTSTVYSRCIPSVHLQTRLLIRPLIHHLTHLLCTSHRICTLAVVG